MKKIIIKGVVVTITFFVALFLMSAILNKGNTDMTGEMGPAVLPLIYMNIDGSRVNCLHGYKEQMDSSNIRETITPLGEGRDLQFVLEKFGAEIKNISFEVRSLDGTRLIEDTKIYGYAEQADYITCKITVKDLIEDHEEYKLIFLVETQDGDIIRYYTRMMKGNNYFVDEKIKFVKDFHNATFNKTAAQNITKYLESNEEGDNSTYHKVNIHSSFHQITWGNLNVEKEGEINFSIRELETQTASFLLDYCVSQTDGRKTNRYIVKEFYRVRYTPERIYLLDFERTMTQILDENQDVFTNNKISLGITNPNIEIHESDGGNVFAFTDAERLYSYNVTDHKFAVLFGFYDQQNLDHRTLYDAHNIKILNVDETGNVQFMVCGYMNRGRHEGRVGIQILRYSSLLNTVEEEIFIPYHDAYDILEADVEKLSYVNRSNVLYLMLKGNIFEIDLSEKTYSIVVSSLSEDSFRVSESNRMIVWQEGEQNGRSTQLCLMNLNTGRQIKIKADSGSYITPLGFMGEDLIFGEAKREEVVRDSSGRMLFPMKTVKIQNENNDILEVYEREGIYVIGCTVEENQINLNRATKNPETGTYIPIKDDQLMNNEVAEKGANVIETAITEKYATVVQIAIKGKTDMRGVKCLTPKEVLFEGGREIILEEQEEGVSRYYVYGKEGIAGIFTEPASAVNLANSISGVVTTDKGSYVWIKGNRSIKNQIMAIKENFITEEKNSLAVCLDTILNFEGIPRNTETMLNQGETAVSILQEQMPENTIMDLTGCSLDAVLYYVNRDIPVMALLEDGNAVLIIGFNELNTVIMDPLTGSVAKKGMNDSKEWFEKNGNRFITYIK